MMKTLLEEARTLVEKARLILETPEKKPKRRGRTSAQRNAARRKYVSRKEAEGAGASDGNDAAPAGGDQAQAPDETPRADTGAKKKKKTGRTWGSKKKNSGPQDNENGQEES